MSQNFIRQGYNGFSCPSIVVRPMHIGAPGRQVETVGLFLHESYQHPIVFDLYGADGAFGWGICAVSDQNSASQRGWIHAMHISELGENRNNVAGELRTVQLWQLNSAAGTDRESYSHRPPSIMNVVNTAAGLTRAAIGVTQKIPTAEAQVATQALGAVNAVTGLFIGIDTAYRNFRHHPTRQYKEGNFAPYNAFYEPLFACPITAKFERARALVAQAEPAKSISSATPYYVGPAKIADVYDMRGVTTQPPISSDGIAILYDGLAIFLQGNQISFLVGYYLSHEKREELANYSRAFNYGDPVSSMKTGIETANQTIVANRWNNQSAMAKERVIEPMLTAPTIPLISADPRLSGTKLAVVLALSEYPDVGTFNSLISSCLSGFAQTQGEIKTILHDHVFLQDTQPFSEYQTALSQAERTRFQLLQEQQNFPKGGNIGERPTAADWTPELVWSQQEITRYENLVRDYAIARDGAQRELDQYSQLIKDLPQGVQYIITDRSGKYGRFQTMRIDQLPRLETLQSNLANEERMLNDATRKLEQLRAGLAEGLARKLAADQEKWDRQEALDAPAKERANARIAAYQEKLARSKQIGQNWEPQPNLLDERDPNHYRQEKEFVLRELLPNGNRTTTPSNLVNLVSASESYMRNLRNLTGMTAAIGQDLLPYVQLAKSPLPLVAKQR